MFAFCDESLMFEMSNIHGKTRLCKFDISSRSFIGSVWRMRIQHCDETRMVLGHNEQPARTKSGTLSTADASKPHRNPSNPYLPSPTPTIPRSH